MLQHNLHFECHILQQKTVWFSCDFNFSISWHTQDDIKVNDKTLNELQSMFGKIPWDEGLVRAATRTTAYQTKVQSRLTNGFESEQILAVIPPGVSGNAHAMVSEIDAKLESLAQLIQPEKIEQANALLKELKSALKLTCGRQARRKGGWEYTDMFLLDSVLLADNLRSVHEGDVMRNAVRQNFEQIYSEVFLF